MERTFLVVTFGDNNTVKSYELKDLTHQNDIQVKQETTPVKDVIQAWCPSSLQYWSLCCAKTYGQSLERKPSTESVDKYGYKPWVF